jgi:hypothetical protein
MRCRGGILLAYVLAAALHAQAPVEGGSQAVILLNRQDEHRSCLTRRNADPEMTVCADQSGLELGSTVRLLVLHRHFLTDYTLRFGDAPGREGATSVVPMVYGGDVRAIGLPVSKVTASVPAPVLQRKTTAEFLAQLLDVTTASEPSAELDHEVQVLNAAIGAINNGINDFNLQYQLIVGVNSAATSCDGAERKRTGFWLAACLQGQTQAGAAVNASGAPQIAEAGFRTMAERAERIFADARNFQSELAAADFAGKARSIESSVAAYEADVRTLSRNLDAANSAVLVLKQLLDPGGSPISLQLRALLRKSLSADATAGSKPPLDEAESNVLVTDYLKMLSNKKSVPQLWGANLENTISQIAALPSSALQWANLQSKITVELPSLLATINDWQERLTDRINHLYEESDVAVTERDFEANLSDSKTSVTYRIWRINEFIPYAFTRSDGASTPTANVQVSQGAFAVEPVPSPPASTTPRTLWQILRIAH